MRHTALPTRDEYSYRVACPRPSPRAAVHAPCIQASRKATAQLSMLLFSPPSSKVTVRFFLLSGWLTTVDAMSYKTELPHRDRALKGRQEGMVVAGKNRNTAATSGNRYVARHPLAQNAITFGGRLFVNGVDKATLSSKVILRGHYAQKSKTSKTKQKTNRSDSKVRALKLLSTQRDAL